MVNGNGIRGIESEHRIYCIRGSEALFFNTSLEEAFIQVGSIFYSRGDAGVYSREDIPDSGLDWTWILDLEIWTGHWMRYYILYHTVYCICDAKMPMYPK
jgi:hypothetical protein